MQENFSGLNAASAAISAALKESAEAAASDRGKALPDGVSCDFERPKHEGQGDRASSIAMQTAKIFSAPPRDTAAKIADGLASRCGDLVEKVEVAGPGFINLFLSGKWFSEAVASVLRQGDKYGSVNVGGGRKVQVEFVSANPTGPLHIGHGRGAAVGDSVARILAFTGWDVQREYYVNDAGVQMQTLGRSTQARYFEALGRPELAPLPENGYKGEYLLDLARRIVDEEGDRFLNVPIEESVPWFRKYAADAILKDIADDLKRFGITFDEWFSETSLYDRDLVKSAAARLEEHGYAFRNDGTRIPVRDKNLESKRGYSFEKDNALWFASTDFGDDQDRVLIRSSGEPTYFASDIAYHYDKFVLRGFERVIDVWGADHHGYVPRIRAAVQAIGKKPEDFDVLLIQLVNLIRDGQPVAMSTRSGEFVTLKAVLDEVGADATRFFFLMRRSDSQLDFDLSLAVKQSSDNPVYYVQYAHARICSIIREWRERGGDPAELLADGSPVPPELFSREDGGKEARALVDTLTVFPSEAVSASREMAPQVITNYAMTLAGAFHSFYSTNHILGEPDDVQTGRLKIAEAARVVLASCLKLLGVSAPERM